MSENTEGNIRGVGSNLPRPLTHAWEWLAISGDRRVVAGFLLAAGFVQTVVIGIILVTPQSGSLASENTAIPLTSALLSGTLLLFSIVVSINSLYVSQQQNPLSQQFGRIQGVVEFRRQLEDVIGADHVPAQPDQLLRVLSGDILERAQYIESEIHAIDVDFRRDLDTYVRSLADETGAMNRSLMDAATTLEILLAMMDYNHDRQINDLRRLQAEYGDQLSAEASTNIEEMLRLLQYFAAAREYFKTIYTRREFARLSRDLTLTTIPTIAIVATFLHFLNDLPDIDLLTTGVVAVAFAPFVLVSTYILRVAIISKRTQAAGQFVAGNRTGVIQGISDEE
ncbi:hypothetical protein [Halorubrum laminariae]|uniref:Uncharacterized protein n=1 Tax=Halorubrum laminariae TaxID=1433523 RepID=A0ABD6BX55_9EURY|nr:hypothetical protein [Halorubrum laminariae]